jgi:hypothetical protein
VPASDQLLSVEVKGLISDNTKPAITAQERADQAKSAIGYLARMASGELKGYDLRGADAALIKVLGDDALAESAGAALSHRAGREVQTALASVVLNDGRPASLRAALASSLRAHLQRFGNQLAADQIQGIFKLSTSAADSALREQADLTAASLRADPAAIGNRLKGFTPSTAPAPPAKAEPGKEGN